MPTPFRYIDHDEMEHLCHRLAVEVFGDRSEPIPPFHARAQSLLDSALNLPRATFDGQDLYKTLPEKSAALYYALVKNHPFPNGNKRIATATLLVFLALNDYWLDSGIQEMTNRAIEVASSDREKKDEVFKNVRTWVADHLVPFEA